MISAVHPTTDIAKILRHVRFVPTTEVARLPLFKLDRHHSLKVGSMQPPHTQGKLQSAVRPALSGIYLLQASALTGLIDCQTMSNLPDASIFPIMTGLER